MRAASPRRWPCSAKPPSCAATTASNPIAISGWHSPCSAPEPRTTSASSPNRVRELETVIALLDAPLPSSDDEHLAEQRALETSRISGPSPSPPLGGGGAEQLDTVLFETYRFLVKVLYLVGETSLPILTSSLRGLAVADRLGRDLEGAAMQALVSGGYAIIGNVERCEHHSRQAIAIAETPRGAAVANHVWRMIAVARAGLGQWAACLDASDRALAALDPEGQNRDAGIWQVRAAVHLCAGDFARAGDAWARTAEIAAHDHNPRLARWSRLDEVQTLLGRGLVVEADRVLTETSVELGAPTDPLGTIEQHYTTALVRSAQGRHAQAVREARSVARMVAATPPSGFHWVEFFAGAVEAMIAALYGADEQSGIDRPGLVAEVAAAAELLERFAATFPHVRPRVALIRAMLASFAGRDAEAAGLFAEAHECAVRGGYDFDAARCVVLCRMSAIDALHHDLAEVREVFERLGATRWVRRVDALTPAA